MVIADLFAGCLAAFSPDGTKVAFTSNRDGNSDMLLDGMLTSQLLVRATDLLVLLLGM
jgi:hypothetical protein